MDQSERLNALADAELRELISESYRLVWERLTKKRRAELESGAARQRKPAARKSKSKSASHRASAKTSLKKTRAKAARRG